jgi:hypothetical protein
MQLSSACPQIFMDSAARLPYIAPHLQQPEGSFDVQPQSPTTIADHR